MDFVTLNNGVEMHMDKLESIVLICCTLAKMKLIIEEF